MTICKACCDTGCCIHCGGSGVKPQSDPKRQCGVCLGSGACADCFDFDPVNPVALYANAILSLVALASIT